MSRDNLGLRPAMVAAASLVVDCVLNVAVSVVAGVAALTSAFAVLLPWTVELCLGVLLVVAANVARTRWPRRRHGRPRAEHGLSTD